MHNLWDQPVVLAHTIVATSKRYFGLKADSGFVLGSTEVEALRIEWPCQDQNEIHCLAVLHTDVLCLLQTVTCTSDAMRVSHPMIPCLNVSP